MNRYILIIDRRDKYILDRISEKKAKQADWHHSIFIPEKYLEQVNNNIYALCMICNNKIDMINYSFWDSDIDRRDIQAIEQAYIEKYAKKELISC